MTWLEELMRQLTPREQEVVRMLGTGLAPKQIARQLGTSPATVRQQLFEARRKANCASVVELAVRVATERGDVTQE